MGSDDKDVMLMVFVGRREGKRGFKAGKEDERW